MGALDSRNHADGIRNQSLIAFPDNAIHVEWRGDRPDSKRAAAESKQENAILRLVGLHEKNVGVTNVALQAVSDGHTEKAREHTGDWAQRAEWLHGADTRMVV